MSRSRSIVKVTTDRVSAKDDAIGRVRPYARPSVSTLSSEPKVNAKWVSTAASEVGSSSSRIPLWRHRLRASTARRAA